MDTLTIHDRNQQLKFAWEDLKAIRSIILTVGDHEEYANAYEVLKVIDRALDSIIGDIQETIYAIAESLKEQNDQKEGDEPV